jgi:hypothetical protein
MMTLLGHRVASDYRAPVRLDGHISYGQSWRSNAFYDFRTFGLNNEAPIPFMVSSLGAFLGPGPMPNSAGISLTSLPTGTTNYAPSDVFSIGRTAIAALQLLRFRDGVIVLPPTLEMCTAFPGSTWHSGLGGGLAPGSNFVGSIDGTTLTVTSLTSGYVAGGQMVIAAGANAQTRVYANLSSTRSREAAESLLADNDDDLDVQQLDPGGVGIYQLNLSFTSLPAQFTGTNPAASFTASSSYGVMTVTDIASGSLAAGQGISGGQLPVGAIFQSQLSGTPGGPGTYLTGLPQTVASQPMIGNGVSWNNMLPILAAVKTGAGVFPTPSYTDVLFSSVGYTQGGAADGTNAGKVQDLTDMVVEFDKLALNPVPLKFYFCLPAQVSNQTVFNDSNQGTYTFCRTHAPGMGGTYSGRVFATGPSYPYQFNGGDNIHTGDYGSSRWGEVEGYARWLVQDKGIAWTPLWRPLTGGAITRTGQVITVPWARPAGPDFASAVMSWQSDPNDGIKVLPQYGFHVRRNNIELTVAPTISGMNVLLAITETLHAGDTLEVSYAWYGPGGPNPGISSGVGGNLVMRGPPSVLYPHGWQGVAKTIDAWAWPFIETMTL